MEKKGYIKEMNYGNVTVVENRDYQWAVIDGQGNFLVPFGKYGWIDGFDSGLARVRTHSMAEQARDSIADFFQMPADRVGVTVDNHCDEQGNMPNFKWGIINEKGEEVLPVVYDNIWNFFRKNRYSTQVEKDGISSEVYFHNLNPSLPVNYRQYSSYHDDYDYVNERHYDEFTGSYAQDVMGYSDEDIYDAFDGDPDAYWNID